MNVNPSRPLAVLALLLLSACSSASPNDGTPTSQPSATGEPAAPTASPESSPSATPDPSASDAAAGAIPTDAIAVARVDGLRVRATPGLNGEELGTLAAGYESLVVDGPEIVDGMEWYLLSGLGLPNGSGCATGPDPTNPYQCPFWLGWVARAGADGMSWLEETEPDCADPNGSMDDFAFQPRYLYIACYGDEPLTLQGYHLATPGIADCPGIPMDLWWLGCVAGGHQLASGPEAAMGLLMTVGPNGSLPGDPGEMVVTGHFDDPASADCALGDEPVNSVLICRSQFVVDSIAP